MAYSYIQYTADGGTQTFTVTFPFINPEHVRVFVDDVEDTTFTWPTTSTITLSSMPGNGAIVLIKRYTPQDARLVDFIPGNTVSEDNLDTDADQGFFAMQEVLEEHADKLGLDIADNEWDAESHQIKNVTDPTEAQHAATKNYIDVDFVADLDAAVTAAELAETNAETAQTAAELAETNAETAETNAETAQTAAEAAQAAAEDTIGDTYYIDSTEVDQGVTGNGKTIKAAVDAIGANAGIIYLQHDSGNVTTPYTLTTTEVISAKTKLVIEDGAIIDGAGTLTIGKMDKGYNYRFGTSITILFHAGGVNGGGVTAIYPEWWGQFPNGYSDHGILNKAIAASNAVGSSAGYDDPNIVVRNGRYYLAHSTLSTIKTNFLAPNAYFSAIDNVVEAGSLFKFDFSEWPEAHNNVEIGTILGKDTMVVGNHYNVGVQVLAGDSCSMKIGALLGLHTGLLMDAGVENEHIGMWDIYIKSLGSIDVGIDVRCGTTAGSSAGVEGCDIKVQYAFYNELTLSVETDSGVITNPTHVSGNVFTINGFEIHNPANLNGIRVSGEGSHSNTFLVPGSFIPCATCNMLTIANAARDNCFEFAHLDWDYITNTTGGYNTFRAISNPTMIIDSLSITSDARSEIMGAAAPTTNKWREGDVCWNLTPSDGVLGWKCITDGAPGTWTELLFGEPKKNILINQDFSIWQLQSNFINPTPGAYTADGYMVYPVDGGGTAPSMTVKKNTTDMENEFEQCCELDITNVGTAGTTRRSMFYQKIEKYKRYRGKTVTGSFRIKADATINLTNGAIRLLDGTQTGSVAITSITTSWVDYQVTIDVAAASTQLTLELSLVNTTGTISTIGSVFIQWMKLEVSPMATSLIPRDEATELTLCQRYFQKSYNQDTYYASATAVGAETQNSTGHTSSDHTIDKSVRFPVMKAAPTVTLYDIAGNVNKVTMAAGNNIAGTVSNIGDNMFKIVATNGAVNTARKLVFQYLLAARV